ncbi:unnamed protein product [Protopolystoma xenopodis]|uniref:E3 UFM1-protein ligase 1-like N-terminal domain-containing protein n=1 Tax=Protopolystoma xenopodis TaxID=117903 RepID=A0A448XJA5_9PLAT|nr:unnamed protein product [Protopolystoma xenopodis]
MSTCGEIRQLVGVLKRTQDEEYGLCLTERTWITILHQLNSRIKLFHTIDGRNFLTKEQVNKEIINELEAHSGRILISELSAIMDIDAHIIESRTADLIGQDVNSENPNRIMGLPGEVISYSYIIRVAREIQDVMEERGFTTLIELSRKFDLPTHLVSNIVDKHMCNVHKDGETIYTDVYLEKFRAKIRGYCNALIRPVTVNVASAKLNLAESIFVFLLEGLIISSKVMGSFVVSEGVFVPSCFVRAQDTYITTFFEQNGYVEWGFIKQIGISDPELYVESKFKEASHSDGISISESLFLQIKAAIDGAISDSSWVDLNFYLPVSVNQKEIEAIMAPFIKGKPACLLQNAIYVVSNDFKKHCFFKLELIIMKKAEEEALRIESLQSFVASRTPVVSKQHEQCNSLTKVSRAACSFEVGAREVKTKNMKRKYVANKKENIGEKKEEGLIERFTDHNSIMSVLLTTDPVSTFADDLHFVLSDDPVSELPSELIDGILLLLSEDINKLYSDCIITALSRMANVTIKKRDYTGVKTLLKNTIMDIQLIERGILAINSDSLRPELLKHLMHKHASLFINNICHLIAVDEDLQWPNANLPQFGCSPNAGTLAKFGYNDTESRLSPKKKVDDQMLDEFDWIAFNLSDLGKFTLIHILFFSSWF